MAKASGRRGRERRPLGTRPPAPRGRPCPPWWPQPQPDRHARHTCPRGALPGNEQLHQVQVATGGRGMQGCPALAVAGVDVGPGLQELLHHLPEVVNAALQMGWPEHQLRPAPSPIPTRLTWCRAVRPSSLARSGLTPLSRNWRTTRRGRRGQSRTSGPRLTGAATRGAEDEEDDGTGGAGRTPEPVPGAQGPARHLSASSPQQDPPLWSHGTPALSLPE